MAQGGGGSLLWEGCALDDDRLGELIEVEHRKQLLVEYCQMKLDVGDWHGVSDAANDLRELEVELRWMRWLGEVSE